MSSGIAAAIANTATASSPDDEISATPPDDEASATSPDDEASATSPDDDTPDPDPAPVLPGIPQKQNHLNGSRSTIFLTMYISTMHNIPA